ncbi:MAG: hypothetical protein HZA52_09525 [Planctomycetes bacterium]|nr:hypothetical protein [Planctomycetota bacterium]
MRLPALAAVVLSVPAAAQTSLITVGAAGVPADNGSLYPELSFDGRFIAYQSGATNLVTGDTNAFADVFLCDRTSGTTVRVSVATGGGEGDEGGLEPALSGDGRFVAFFSSSTNLVPNDLNGVYDIFVHDAVVGTTERVSLASSGVEGNGASRYAAISGDGRWVAFESKATNLVAGDTLGWRDVFVRDRATGTLVRASVDALGNEADGESLDAAISPEGRWVAFESLATNLVAGDTNGASDIFLKDLQTGAISRLSVSSLGIEGNGASVDPSITNNGRYVAFGSSASNLVAFDTNGFDDVFYRDVIAGVTRRASVSSIGNEADEHSHDPQFTPDGTHVAFYSGGTNLDHYLPNVFLHEVMTSTLERISIGSAGQQATQGSYWPAISADARWVAFDSFDSNLVFADANGVRDIFVRDRASPFLPFCFGDAASAVACPCANAGDDKHGCENSASSGGATLEAFGDPSTDTVRLVTTRELPSALSFVMQSPGTHGNALPFGDGLLCLSGGLKRLYVKNASAGSVSVPAAGDPSLATRSAALGDPLTPGTTRFYQVYYRDPSPTHCGSTTFNLTNAVRIVW